MSGHIWMSVTNLLLLQLKEGPSGLGSGLSRAGGVGGVGQGSVRE